jgi:hypothetical protein
MKLIIVLLSICVAVLAQSNSEPCTAADLNAEKGCWLSERCKETVLEDKTYDICPAEPTRSESSKEDPITHEETISKEETSTHEEPSTHKETGTTEEKPHCDETTGANCASCIVENEGQKFEVAHGEKKVFGCTYKKCWNGEVHTGTVDSAECSNTDPSKCNTETGVNCAGCKFERDGTVFEIGHGHKATYDCSYIKCWNGELIEGKFENPECQASGCAETECKNCEFKVEATGEVLSLHHGDEKELRDCAFVKCNDGKLSDYKRDNCELTHPPAEGEEPKPVGECGENSERKCRDCVFEFDGSKHEVPHATKKDAGSCRWVKCWDGVISSGHYDDSAECRGEEKEDETRPEEPEKIEIHVTFVAEDVLNHKEELERLFKLILSSGATVTISDITKNDDGSYSAVITISQDKGDLGRKDAETIRKDAEEIAPFESKNLQISGIEIATQSEEETSESSASTLLLGSFIIGCYYSL